MTRTFNTPLEAGMRALFLLSAAGRRGFDTQQLVYFDYALVHSGDLPAGPASLHPTAPSKKSELLVRRALMQAGLELMRSRELVERRFRKSGIVYTATKAGRSLIRQFESEYARLLRQRADWVINALSAKSDAALADLLGARAGRWEDELIEHAAAQDLA